MTYIKKEIQGQVGIICFNNDDKRNSLNLELLEEFKDAFEEFEQQKLRAVILRSNPGAKVWSAGLAINELPEPGKDPLPFNHPLELLMRKVEDFPAPVIGMIEGSVWGGACDLAFTCDILIGSPKCSFAITPAKIGVPYNATGLSHFLNFVEMNIAKEMFFTAKPIDADRAYNLGIINHLIDVEELEEFTFKMAKGITYNSPLAISIIKKQLNLLGRARPMNPEVYEQITSLRRDAYSSQDFLEGRNAFLEKRKPVFKGE
jgi:methylmalonyl-CoA decarboxylase